MSNDRIWILLGKQLSGDISSTELVELETLMKDDPEVEASRELAATIWQTPLQEVSGADSSKERIWNMVDTHMHLRYRRPVIRRLATAAAAAVVLTAVWAGWRYTRPAASSPQQLHSLAGGKSRMVLPDGSTVWLNANTRLHYEESGFSREHREITLSGEAYFDIAKNDRVPFIVHAGRVNIRVLGTAFNVKAYADDSIVSTTLVSGKVAISFQGKTVVLHPEEKITVAVTSPAPVFEPQHLEKDSSGHLPEISWLDNKLVFDNNAFSELADKMSQWYGVTFHFESTNLQQLRFSGIINTESLDEALKMLQLSRPFNFRINGKEVYISN